MGDPHWPLFDLRIRTPRLELRLPRDDDLYALIDAFQSGVHDPATMPFLVPWTDTPSPRREREALQWWWSQRAGWKPEAWNLTLCCVVDGRSSACRTSTPTTSPPAGWSPPARGWRSPTRGKASARRCALRCCTWPSSVWERRAPRPGPSTTTQPSLAVTRALGYQPNGDMVKMRRGVPHTCLEFVMDRDGFDRIRRDDIVIEHLEPALPMFGLGADE